MLICPLPIWVFHYPSNLFVNSPLLNCWTVAAVIAVVAAAVAVAAAADAAADGRAPQECWAFGDR